MKKSDRLCTDEQGVPKKGFLNLYGLAGGGSFAIKERKAGSAFLSLKIQKIFYSALPLLETELFFVVKA